MGYFYIAQLSDPMMTEKLSTNAGGKYLIYELSWNLSLSKRIQLSSSQLPTACLDVNASA
jgi:hypothetical protein